MRSVLIWTILGTCFAVSLGCSNDDGGSNGAAGGAGEATCESLVSTLTDCGLLTGTRLRGCANDDPVLPCLMGCVRAASCAELEARYCYLDFNHLAECLEGCQAALPSPEFVCDDLSRIPASYRCDGAQDCSNGEDEECLEGRFVCDSGLSIPAGWQCDGVEDCPNGGDELDCSGDRAMVCDDGTRLPAARECDGTEDCAAGEDELDCAYLICE